MFKLELNSLQPVNRGDVSPIHEKFDLIIARDLIEHVNNPARLLDNVVQMLSAKGFFHFITPNGHEDVWPHHMQWKFKNIASELLINHVNYFDGQGLRSELYLNKPVMLPQFEKKNVLNQWYIQAKLKSLCFLVSWYYHHVWLLILPDRNIGHEISGLFQKKS